jgi:homoserine O-acetyltransferase
LVESLGIERLHAVVGASMGALQAIEWVSAYPEVVGRVVAAIGAGEADAFLIAWLNLWAAPIILDPHWNGGDYYDAEAPLDGLAEALKLVTLHARHWEWADAQFGRQWADEGKDPAAAFGNQYAIEAFLDQAARSRAAGSDANHFLYLVKANQLFMAGHGGSLEEGLANIEAPVLLLPATDDLIFFSGLVQRTRDLIGADGTPVQYQELEGTLGHLDGLASLNQVAERIRAFLEE